MNQRIFYFTLTALMSVVTGWQVSSGQNLNPDSREIVKVDQPNIIFFALDDMNTMINPLGYNQAKTPNLDRLASQGMTFTNAHAPSPFCAPSRTAIWTGLQASTTGCYSTEVFHYDFPEITTLQMSLKEKGYNTYGSGKLYHHREGYLDLRDWDEYFSRNDNIKNGGYRTGYDQEDLPLPDPYPYSPYYRKTDKKIDGGKFMEWGPIPMEKVPSMMDNQRTEFIANIVKKSHKKPFFAALGLYVPHFPNYVPQNYWDMYDEDEIIIQEIKKDDFEDLPEPIRTQMRNRFKIYQTLEELGALKEATKGYLAAVSYADGLLGEVLDALESGPNKDNTIIVLWSDHGYHLGQKGNWGKHTSWKETSRVPLIWSGNGLPKNVKVDATVGLIDLYPTLIDVCGLKKPHEMDGESLIEILKNPETAKDRSLLIPSHEMGGYAVVNQEWRYIQYPNGSEELYDLKSDPNEYTNLATEPAYNKMKDQLKEVAPDNFRKPATSREKLELVLDGGGKFHWESKDGSKPQGSL